VTSDGGLILVRELDERLGLSEVGERFTEKIDIRDLIILLHDKGRYHA
jgi:hypothetical protein